MPFDLTPIDVIALIWFLAVWLTYNLVLDHLVHGPVTLNQNMKALRGVWMRRMLERENRIMDAQLIGHLISSVSFFASTTVLVLAGLLGVLGAVDDVYAAIGRLSFTVKTTKLLFEFKILVLLGIFIFAFFKFTWALRQFNYSCAVIGAAPLAPVPKSRREGIAAPAADVLSLAISNFNGGLRSYYFALAALSWFIQPWLFILVTAWILLVLLRRHLLSAAFRAVRQYVHAIADGAPADAGPGAPGRPLHLGASKRTADELEGGPARAAAGDPRA